MALKFIPVNQERQPDCSAHTMSYKYYMNGYTTEAYQISKATGWERFNGLKNELEMSKNLTHFPTFKTRQGYLLDKSI